MNNHMIIKSCISNKQHASLPFIFRFAIKLLFKKCLPAMRLFFPYSSIASILIPNSLQVNLDQSKAKNVNGKFAVIRLTLNSLIITSTSL